MVETTKPLLKLPGSEKGFYLGTASPRRKRLRVSAVGNVIEAGFTGGLGKVKERGRRAKYDNTRDSLLLLGRRCCFLSPLFFFLWQERHRRVARVRSGALLEAHLTRCFPQKSRSCFGPQSKPVP